jgi:hypothetical protein
MVPVRWHGSLRHQKDIERIYVLVVSPVECLGGEELLEALLLAFLCDMRFSLGANGLASI